ncbi:MAG TPA: RNA polymerase sigma factor [Bacteroidia bacterium]|nr:RNA polymerase sigma factor [Bacteroidia bacterium]
MFSRFFVHNLLCHSLGIREIRSIFIHRKMTNAHSSLTDLELVALYKQGDKNALGVLFKRYTHQLFGVCLKYLKDTDESKDAVMSIFEKLQSDLFKHEITFFKSWLYAVTRNHCLMILRSRKGIFHQSVDEEGSGLEVMEMHSLWHPDDALEKETTYRKLEEAIKKLKEEQRICIDLFYLQEKSYKEVCDITGFTMLNVKSHIQNGKRNLKIILERGHGQ